jgi:hypothetical protein
MNRDDDFNRTLQAWLRREAPPQSPDRVLESALQRISTQSQRRSWQQRLVGETPMATLLRAAALAAAVAIAVVGGLQISKLIPDVGESSPSPTVGPSASASPSSTPPAGCVNPPTDITTLIDMVPTGPADPGVDPVACYGNAPLTFDATWVGGGVADCPAAPEPAWLACSPVSLQALGDTRKLGAPGLFVAVDPSADLSIISGPFAQVRVTGHFDDPAAQTCRETQLGGGAQSLAPAAVTIERCRSTFVVTEVTEVSDPSVAALVLRLEGGAEDGRVHLLTVLEDGRIITTSHQGTSHPTVERRLTAAGVQLLLDELDATGLTLLTSADYSPVAKPGADGGYGGAGPALVVGLPAGGTAVTSWVFMPDPLHLTWEPQPEAEALDALYARLTTLDKWLRASAWADANPRPYLPAQYRVNVTGNPWGGSLDELIDVSDVNWPVSASVTDLLDQIVAASKQSDSTSDGCSVLTAADAALVQAALVEVGAPAGGYYVPSYRVGDRAAAREIVLVFDPIMPRDETGCDGGYSPSF